MASHEMRLSFKATDGIVMHVQTRELGLGNRKFGMGRVGEREIRLMCL